MKKLSYAIILTSAGLASIAHAEINFRGFGSIVGGQATGLEAGETVLGYTEDLDFKRDSLMALQMGADLDDNLTATLQIMSRGRNDYEAEIEWAYLTYEINDELQISAGRIRPPFYRYSDFLDVRYSYNWITAPEHVYGVALSGYDGISILFNNSLGPIDSSLQIVGGTLDAEFESDPILLENFIGASWVGTWEWLTARASYVQSNITYPQSDIEGVANGLEQLGAGMLGIGAGFGQIAAAAPSSPLGQRAALYASSYTDAGNSYLNTADKARIAKDKAPYTAFALAVDKGSLVIDTELINYEVQDGMLPETTAYYITTGWRFGKTIAYATYSRQKIDAPTDVAFGPIDLSSVAASIAGETLLPSDPIPAFGDATLQQAAVGLAQQGKGLTDTLAAGKVDIVNWHLGIRWDFHSSAAFKVSYENTHNRISDVDGSVIRTAIDMVF